MNPVCFFNVLDTAHIATRNRPIWGLRRFGMGQIDEQILERFPCLAKQGSRNLTYHILPPIWKAARIQGRPRGRDREIRYMILLLFLSNPINHLDPCLGLSGWVKPAAMAKALRPGPHQGLDIWHLIEVFGMLFGHPSKPRLGGHIDGIWRAQAYWALLCPPFFPRGGKAN